MSPIQAVLVFAAIATAVVEKFFKPIRSFVLERFPTSAFGPLLDFLTPYVAWAISGSLVYYSGVNLFPDLLSPAIGNLVTAVASGFGANSIHDILSIPQTFAREMAVYREAGYSLDAEEFSPCLVATDNCCGEGDQE